MMGLLLVACSGPAAAKSAGDPEQGKMIFNQSTIREAPGCVTCHSIESGRILVGPSLSGVATRAEARIPGQPAVEYLHTCITDPNAYIVAGFSSGVMYQNFEEVLSEEEINHLVAYLLTLK